MISKPDANPVVALVLTAFVFGLGHVIVNGQTNKWVWILVTSMVGSVLCCIPGFVVHTEHLRCIQDGRKAQKRRTIEQNEYSLPLLYKMCKILDKKATCKNA